MLFCSRQGAEIANIGGDVDARSFRFAENYGFNDADPARSVPALPAPEVSPAGGADPRLDAELRPAPDGPAAAYRAHAAGLDGAWERQTGRFAWAWERARERAQRIESEGGR